MYKDIGKKLKLLAKIAFIVGVVLSVILGIGLIISFSEEGIIAIIGLFVMLIGGFLSWVSSWGLYGFGELIDKTCDIEKNIHGGEGVSDSTHEATGTQFKAEAERIAKIQKLYFKGLITEEEYNRVLYKEQEAKNE